jgi:hypothetical protein
MTEKERLDGIMETAKAVPWPNFVMMMTPKQIRMCQGDITYDGKGGMYIKGTPHRIMVVNDSVDL